MAREEVKRPAVRSDMEAERVEMERKKKRKRSPLQSRAESHGSWRRNDRRREEHRRHDSVRRDSHHERKRHKLQSSSERSCSRHQNQSGSRVCGRHRHHDSRSSSEWREKRRDHDHRGGRVMPSTRLPIPPVTEPLSSRPLLSSSLTVIPWRENYDPKGYNPESSGQTTADCNPYHQCIPHVQPQWSNVSAEQSSRIPETGSAPSDKPQQSSLDKITPVLTNTQKSVFTSAELQSSSKSLEETGKVLEAEVVLNKNQEALKLQNDMRKKQQELLKMQIECQKVLINRLEKNRGMKPEERANIMKILKELMEKTAKLQNEMNFVNHSLSTQPINTQPQPKTDKFGEMEEVEDEFAESVMIFDTQDGENVAANQGAKVEDTGEPEEDEAEEDSTSEASPHLPGAEDDDEEEEEEKRFWRR